MQGRATLRLHALLTNQVPPLEVCTGRAGPARPVKARPVGRAGPGLRHFPTGRAGPGLVFGLAGRAGPGLTKISKFFKVKICLKIGKFRLKSSVLALNCYLEHYLNNIGHFRKF